MQIDRATALPVLCEGYSRGRRCYNQLVTTTVVGQSEISEPRPGARSIHAAYQDIVKDQLDKLHERAGDVRAGTSPAAIHKLRVTVRRLRSALRLLAEYSDKDSLRKIRGFARSLAQALGTVRDLDVAQEHLNRYCSALPEERQAVLSPLLRIWQEQRRLAFWGLLALLNGEEFRSWMRQAAALTREPVADGASRVAEALPLAIWQQYIVVRQYETRLSGAPVAVLHELRIETKRLRYLLEFFRKDMGREAQEAIRELSALQEQLGQLHDTDVVGQRVAEFAASRSLPPPSGEASPLARETAAYQLFVEGELVAIRAAAMQEWELITAQPFRISLAKAAAAM
jgi:CHAD domain-containing protein